MNLNSYNTEFGYELIATLPFAYYLHKKKQLVSTESAIDTRCLYYFSPKHIENNKARSWFNTPKAKQIPNIDIHKPYLKEGFLPPPLKEVYKNERFKFEKELVIICNRINIEWSTKAINYFDLETLDSLFKLLCDKYQVIYINIEGKTKYYDNEKPVSIGDYEFIKRKYKSKVINIHDLHNENKDLTFNTLQLMLFANCSKFITLNGGHAILAAYFGGENIIMSKYGTPQAKEINERVNSYYRWYKDFSGQRVVHAAKENELIDRVKSMYVRKDPIINIIVRTSFRPNYFHDCINSIEKQTYKNYNIWVTYDNEETNKYIIPYKVYPVKVIKKNVPRLIKNSPEYGVSAPYNLYFNEVYKYINSGYIMFLDDDDKFNSDFALETIVSEIEKGNKLIFWRVRNGEKIFPSEKNWLKAPVLCDISGIGFCFDSKYKDIAKWEGYKRGDFRVSNKLYNAIDKTQISYINLVLSCTQKAGNRFGNQTDKNELVNKKIEKNMKRCKVIFPYLKKQRITVINGIRNIEVGQIIDLPDAIARNYEKQRIVEIIEENKPKNFKIETIKEEQPNQPENEEQLQELLNEFDEPKEEKQESFSEKIINSIKKKGRKKKEK